MERPRRVSFSAPANFSSPHSAGIELVLLVNFKSVISTYFRRREHDGPHPRAGWKTRGGGFESMFLPTFWELGKISVSEALGEDPTWNWWVTKEPCLLLIPTLSVQLPGNSPGRGGAGGRVLDPTVLLLQVHCCDTHHTKPVERPKGLAFAPFFPLPLSLVLSYLRGDAERLL